MLNNVPHVELLGSKVPIVEIPDFSHISAEQRQIWSDWINALNGGEYEQTTGALRRNIAGKTKYCCLGVLADVETKKPGCKTLWGTARDIDTTFPVEILPNCFILEDIRENEKELLGASYKGLTFKLRNKAGILQSEGFLVMVATKDKDRGTTKSLAALNDSGATFKDIAVILTYAMNGGYRMGFWSRLRVSLKCQKNFIFRRIPEMKPDWIV